MGKATMGCGVPGPEMLGPEAVRRRSDAWRGPSQACRGEAGNLARG